MYHTQVRVHSVCQVFQDVSNSALCNPNYCQSHVLIDIWMLTVTVKPVYKI